MLVEVLVPLKGAGVSAEVLLELIAAEAQLVVSAEAQRGVSGVGAQQEVVPKKALAGVVKDPYLEDPPAGAR